MSEMWFMTEERELIRNAAKDYAIEELRPALQRIEGNEYPRDLLKRACELGFLEFLVPEELGGSGIDNVSNGLMLEEISKENFTMGVLVATLGGMAIKWIIEAGTPEQIEKWALPAMRGEINLGMSQTEPIGLLNVLEHSTRAVLDGDEWVINGNKIFTTSAGHCDAYIVGAITSDPDPVTMSGYSEFIVPADVPGVEIGHIENKLGMHGSSTGTINFRNVRLPKDAILGPKDMMAPFLMTGMNAEWAGAGAIGLGLAEGIYERVWKYTHERIQGGKSLYDAHQVMRDTFGKMAIEIEATRALVFSTLESIDRDGGDAKQAIACKVKASSLAEWVASECVNLCGGHGAIVENDFERYYRDAKLMFIAGGAHNTLIDLITMFL